MRYDRFWQWFMKNEVKLRKCAPEATVDALEKVLSKVDTRLGIEVADEGDLREVTITAASDKTAFDIVKTLIRSAPCAKGWSFHALKPASGFHFVISLGGQEINAKELMFDPLTSSSRPRELGIRVFLSEIASGDAELTKLLWLIIETGIGEEAAGKISYLEISKLNVDRKELLPIADLGDYVTWFFSQKCSR